MKLKRGKVRRNVALFLAFALIFTTFLGDVGVVHAEELLESAPTDTVLDTTPETELEVQEEPVAEEPQVDTVKEPVAEEPQAEPVTEPVAEELQAESVTGLVVEELQTEPVTESEIIEEVKSENMQYADLEEFYAACDAMGDAGDMDSVLATLGRIERAYYSLSPEDQASVTDQWAYVQAYAADVRAGNPDEDIAVTRIVDKKINIRGAASKGNPQYEQSTTQVILRDEYNNKTPWTVPSASAFFTLGACTQFDYAMVTTGGYTHQGKQSGLPVSVEVYSGGTVTYYFKERTHYSSDYSLVERKEPTCYETGSIVKKCPNCGKIGSTQTLPKLEADYSGQNWYDWNGQERMDCKNCGGGAPGHYKTRVKERMVMVKWIDWNDTLLYKLPNSIKESEIPAGDQYTKYSGKKDPTRIEDENYTYTFSRWEKTVDADGNVTYKAIYTATPKEKEKVTVKWVDEDGTTILDGPKSFNKGETEPGYEGEKPTKEEDADNTYEFDKWEKTEDADGNITYRATYTATPKEKDKEKVTVKWVDEDGTTILDGPKSFNKGETEPGYEGEKPTKEEDADNTYEFDKWEKTEDADGNITYRATYTATPKEKDKEKVTVKWVDEDGTTILDGPKSFNKGETEPGYEGKKPTKEEDADNTYEFNKWEKTEDADGNITYRATYTATPKEKDKEKVTVKWVDEDRTTILDGPKSFNKGETEPEYEGKKPTKEEDADNTYEFDKWEKTEDADGNITYRATYTATPKEKDKEKVTVKWVDEDGTTILDGPKSFNKGETEPEYEGKKPTKEEDAGNTYEFDKWEKTVDEDGNITYRATYTATPKEVDPEDPTPENPTPEDPTPENPTPEDPTPENPTPEDPTPEDPTPVNPTPEDPTPENPTPEDPMPENPTPGDLGTTTPGTTTPGAITPVETPVTPGAPAVTPIAPTVTPIAPAITPAVTAPTVPVTPVVTPVAAAPTPTPVTPAVTPAALTPVTPALTPNAEEATPGGQTETQAVPDDETPLANADLEDEEVPLAGNSDRWALINFALMNLSVFESLMLLIGYFIQTKKSSEEEEEDEKERKLKKKGIIRIVSLPIAIISLIAFFLTENIWLPTRLVDQYTLMMAVIAVIQTIMVVLSRKEEVTEEEEPEAEMA